MSLFLALVLWSRSTTKSMTTCPDCATVSSISRNESPVPPRTGALLYPCAHAV
jgi:hypothetical protein